MKDNATEPLILTKKVENTTKAAPLKKQTHQTKQPKIDCKSSLNKKKSGTPTSTKTPSLHSQLILHSNLRLMNPAGRNDRSSGRGPPKLYTNNDKENSIPMKSFMIKKLPPSSTNLHSMQTSSLF